MNLKAVLIIEKTQCLAMNIVWHTADSQRGK